MQLKSSSPVATEKRMDLASLFCMIGRHGPAVAVAVITMVSVLAGIIIYRNVKGKRRKAAAEAGAAEADSRSSGTRADETLLQAEESPSRVESTAVDLPVQEGADETLGLLKIRNRRAVTEKKLYCPQKDSEPDDKRLRSLMPDSRNLQSNASTAENVEVKHDCQDTTDETVKSAMEHHGGILKPAAICESHDEKVLKSDEDEKVTTKENVMGHNVEDLQLDIAVYSEENAMSQTQDGKEEEILAETNCMEPCLEEPICHTNVEVGMEDHMNFSKDDALFPEREMKSEVEERCVDDQMSALQQEIEVSAVKQTCLPSSLDNETVIDEMPSIQDVNGQLKPLNDPACDQETDIEKEMLPSTCDATHNHQSVFSHALLTLNQSVESDVIDNILCDQTADAKDHILDPKHEVKDEIVPDLAIDAFLEGLCPDARELKNTQDENVATTDVMPNEENVASSPIGHPDPVVCQKANLAEMPHSNVVLSLQDTHIYANTAKNLELSETAPNMSENAKPPICQIPLSFDPIDLTWSSSGAGEESGISSMTVSPDLQDAVIGSDITNEYVTHLMDCCPGSEQTRAQIPLFADDEAISVNKAAIVPAPGSYFDPATSSQKPEGNQMDGDRSLTGCVDMLGHGATISSIVQVSELENETDVKVLENKEKTEINIMAATMDNNEWITDGNYQVNPWMNLSTKPHSRLPVDASREEVNTPSSETGQTIPCENDADHDAKIVAVQPMPQNVNVTFSTHYLTHSPYQKVAITGNQQELGHWKDFIPLERTKDGDWAKTVCLPAESHVEWKFVVLDKGEVCRWEECGNRLLDTGYGDLLVHKWWGL